MIHAVWIEIPVQDIERASKFYQEVFQLPHTDVVTDDVRRINTLFGGSAEGRAGFSLTQTKDFEPSLKGPFVYLDTSDGLAPYLHRIEAAGGKVIAPKTSMGTAGNYASFQDTEGNLLGLYSST